MTFEQRLGRVFQLALPKLGPDAREEIANLVKPASLEIIAGVLAGWIVGHLVGVGELVDVVLAVVGFFSIGLAVFSGIDELFLFARETWSGASDHDFEDAAGHLAKAVAILGIQAVLALLFRERPRIAREPAGVEPPRTPGLRYEPSTTATPSLPEGEGYTTSWGDVTVSSAGSKTDRELVLLHEKVHQLLTPKFYFLRRFRVENRDASYFQTSLIRYIEEALAETAAQIGVQGMAKAVEGIRFPVQNRYVYIFKRGGYDAGFGGAGLAKEGAALLGSGAVGAFAFEVWLGERDARVSSGVSSPTSPDIPWIMP